MPDRDESLRPFLSNTPHKRDGPAVLWTDGSVSYRLYYFCMYHEYAGNKVVLDKVQVYKRTLTLMKFLGKAI